jgi:uncharacterized protein
MTEMIKRTKNLVLLSLGFLSLFLGILGAFLPILPTTPFAILSAYLFSKSSKRCHNWLLRQPMLGPLIMNWERHGMIRLRAKIWSTTLIIPLFIYTLIYVDVALAIKIIVSLIGISVLTFIWSRPSTPQTRLEENEQVLSN